MKLSDKVRTGCIIAVPVILFLLLTLWQPFSFADSMLCDSLYRQVSGVSPNIKIIAIDEETLEAYGKLEGWAREKTAQVLELLYKDPAHCPEMIGLDLLFTDESEPDTDRRLIAACEKANYVVMSSNVVYRGITRKTPDGRVYFDERNIALIEEPFPALAEVIDSGFANALIAPDGHVRYVRLYEEYQGRRYPNFSWQLYSAHMRGTGRMPRTPRADSQGQMAFFYSGRIGEFPHFSLSRVLSGEIPVSEFENCIVLIGAYAPGFQDAYGTSVDRGGQMYGVEIHANVIQALMQGKTAVMLPLWLYCAASCLMIGVLFAIAAHKKLMIVLSTGAAMAGIHLIAGRFLAIHGYLMPQLYFLLAVAVSMVYFVAEKYLAERLRKKKLLEVFKTYVAPQVVDVLSKDDRLSSRLGGEKRHVAVLFADIRGFTRMSEGLPPENVVKILNECLALTTQCIFQNQGTLDKFIGDATMAVFNAPVDLSDYVYRAVAAALDMQTRLEPLSRRLMERYGEQVSFGIGINCGEAVIGNIGCRVRMDYTAIGDTVNTAARLESQAGKGEILISEAVKRQVSDRIATEFVAELELKGKANGVKTYRVLGYKEGKPGEKGISDHS